MRRAMITLLVMALVGSCSQQGGGQEEGPFRGHLVGKTRYDGNLVGYDDPQHPEVTCYVHTDNISCVVHK